MSGRRVVYVDDVSENEDLQEEFREGTDLVIEDGLYSEMVNPIEKRAVKNREISDLEDQPDWMVFSYPEDEPIVEWLYWDEAERLKNVNQHGPHSLYRPDPLVNRFEHSWGTMMLERIFDRSKEAQVAALLHDPHGPFSHWSELVLGDDNNRHERRREYVLEGSDYLEVLEDSDLVEVDNVLEPGNFPSLEKSRPELCADRIDYALRDMVALSSYENRKGDFPLLPTMVREEWERVKEYAESLVLIEHEDGETFAINDSVAESFTDKFLSLESGLYFNPEYKLIDHVTAHAAREMLNDGVVSVEEFWGMTDDEVWNEMKNYEPSRRRLEKLEEALEDGSFVLGAESKADVSLERPLKPLDPVTISGHTVDIKELGKVGNVQNFSLDELLEDQRIEPLHVERVSDYHRGSFLVQKRERRDEEDFHFRLRNDDYEPVELRI